MNTIALLITGALGMLGWFCAWLAQRSANRSGVELRTAAAGEAAARVEAIAAAGRATSAETLLRVERGRADSLQVQLDAERKARQDLVHALASKGLPVGDAVVDAAVDRLYPDGGGQGPGPGAGTDDGGGPQRLPGQPADAADPSGPR